LDSSPEQQDLEVSLTIDDVADDTASTSNLTSVSQQISPQISPRASLPGPTHGALFPVFFYSTKRRHSPSNEFSSPGSQWSVADVCTWLEHVGMGEYQVSFELNKIDGAALLLLNSDSLKELGVMV
jgi:hypothetical protein